MQLDNPLIVQSDRTLLLDVHAPLANECRNELIPFAELERSPEHLHTYRLTPLSLWNASSAGFMPQDAVNVLQKYALRRSAVSFFMDYGNGRSLWKAAYHSRTLRRGKISKNAGRNGCL